MSDIIIISKVIPLIFILLKCLGKIGRTLMVDLRIGLKLVLHFNNNKLLSLFI